MQPRMEISTDIERYVRRNFPAPEVTECLNVLARAVLHDGNVPDHRMLRCAVVACDKSLDSLKYYVECLAIDFRDVIVAGGYEQRKGEIVHVRDLSKPFEAN